MPKLKRDDGVEIHWEERGQGPVVFFAHAGWGSMPSTYSDLLTDLATDHRVVTRDPRGVGQSTRRGPYDVDTDAADLAALVDEVGGPRVVVSAGANASCVRVVANDRSWWRRSSSPLASWNSSSTSGRWTRSLPPSRCSRPR